MSSQYLRIFQQPRSAILLILGFASGLPLALTSGTLQAWMTVENIDLKTIGFFSLVGQAYVFKFLWSPLMDRYTPPFLGRRRGWLLATQALLLLAIAAMGFLEPGTQLRWMAALAVVIAFCSASQDIVFDAWKTDVLPAEERGAGAAISVLGYRLGMLVSGGLALWLADKWLRPYMIVMKVYSDFPNILVPGMRWRKEKLIPYHRHLFKMENLKVRL